MMTPATIAEKVVKILDSKLAKDIKLLKTDKLTVLADYFVICTANTATHIKTLTGEVDKLLSEAGEPPLRVEGYRSGGWVLIDFGCVIVHIFVEDVRDFYNLERLWGDAEVIDISGMIAE